MKRQAKALVAGAVGVLTYLVPTVDDGLVLSECLGALLAGLVSWQAVYWVRNERAVSGNRP